MMTDKPTFVENLVYDYVYPCIFVYGENHCLQTSVSEFLHIGLLSHAYFKIIIGDILQKLA